MTQPSTSSAPAPERDFSIIGIGTSAGGLDVLKTFISHVPLDCRHSFVIIQHLSPDYKSLMAELLAKSTSLPILEVRKTTQVEPGSIYLIPPKKNLTFKSGKLLLSNKPKGRVLNLPIDIFFTSLAEELGKDAIGIILTGSGSDGTRGIRAIKEVGGMVMVQDPDQAQFTGMPQSAINTGLVDFVLPAEDLGEELFNFIDNPSAETRMQRSLERDEDSFLRIINLAKSSQSVDFGVYKRPTLIRRIVRRMGITKCSTPQEYVKFIYENEYEAHLLSKEFLVGVTKFFRDVEAWDAVRSAIAERISQKKGDDILFKAWVAGCSTGEEAYTLAMIIHEELLEQNHFLPVKIFATDIQKESLEIANKGQYPESIVADIHPEYLQKYFTRRVDQYRIDPEIRKMVIFSGHDILRDPPFSKVDIAICRNMLIYFQQAAQDKVIKTLHYALGLNGILFLGGSESLGSFSKGLVPVERKHKIYLNKKLTDPPRLGPILSRENWISPVNSHRGHRSVSETGMSEALNQILSDSWGMVAVYIDDTFEILHAVGEIRKYLNFPNKGFSANFLRLIPSTLSVLISSAVRKAQSTGETVVHPHYNYDRESEIEVINVTIAPVKLDNTETIEYFVVTFLPKETFEFSQDSVKIPEESSEHMVNLENELKITRQNLQATIEEVETSNEELQATNEELMSANEEMQSTNEELQSVNEELHTVNAEYQQKLEEVSVLNSEMENLIKSTQIGTIFLDTDMRIRKFTPSIREHFRLEDQDIGRPLTHFVSTFEGMDNESLINEAKAVLRTTELTEVEIKTKEGKWFLRRITPYRNELLETTGVVMTFVDITELKQAELERKKAENFSDKIIQNFPGIISVVNVQERRNTFLSPTTEQVIGYTAEEIQAMGDKMRANIFHPDDLDKVEAYVEQVAQLEENQSLSRELRVRHKSGEWLWGRFVDSPLLKDDSGTTTHILSTAIDITQRKLNELEKEEMLAFRNRIDDAFPGIVYVYSLKEHRNIYASRTIEELMGYTPEEVRKMASDFTQNIFHPEEIGKILAHHQNVASLPDGESRSLKYRVRHKDGTWYWMQSTDTPFKRNEEGEVIELLGTAQDISVMHNSESQVEKLLRERDKLFENFPGMLFVHDIESDRNKFVSASVEQLLGYSPKELEEMGDQIYTTLFHPEEMENRMAHFERVRQLKPGEQLIQDYRARRKDGSWIWLHSVYQPYSWDEQGRLTEFIGSSIDISAWKEKESAYRKLG